ncbi:MAG: AbrB/MazE/SpoVT family DNA-binding domain-containing protein [Terriglobales bacterium]
MKAMISEKGRVTIPKRLRDNLALTPGTTIEFEERDGTLVGARGRRGG